MKLSRRMLMIAILLTSGMMAASEFPELLTLTDNVANDYELTCQGLRGCSSQQIVDNAITPSHWLVTANLEAELPVYSSSTTLLEEATSLPLSILGVQRK